MQTGDIVLAGGSLFKVRGVYLGALGKQSLIEIESLSKEPGSVAGGPSGGYRIMCVPQELVDLGKIYREVQDGR